ncbi:MAG: amidase [Polyangiaceae bacterium]|nr:amidase [Polyangiaceae bacterium]
MSELLKLSGLSLAKKIRRKEVSSRTVVEAHIGHIQKVNPVLNAMVQDRFEEALAEADAADRALVKGDALPPFHGVPCSIKEAFAVRGMPNTSGLVARKGRLAERDAITVERLRKAGSIVLGVTNISELCMWMESNNRVYGRSNNPYDPTRTVGGSSGGEGAIIGVGGAPYGLGSDIGGSIRMPAFFNGVFGHKPSGGLVPNAGQFPPATPGIEDYVCTGPIARRAEDLYPLMQVLLEGETRAHRLKDPADVDLSTLTVSVVEDDGVRPVDAELLSAMGRAAQALAKRGAKIKSVHIPDFKHAFAIWGAMVGEGGGPSFAELLGEGTPIPIAKEIARFAAGKSPHTLPALALALLELVPKVAGSGQTQKFVELGQKLQREVVELIGPNGVLLYPPHPLPAPKHNAPLFRPFRWVYTAIFNVLKLPVTAVPMGLSREGAPLGVQVASVPWNDHVTLAVARALEEDAGGWQPPPMWFG